MKRPFSPAGINFNIHLEGPNKRVVQGELGITQFKYDGPGFFLKIY